MDNLWALAGLPRPPCACPPCTLQLDIGRCCVVPRHAALDQPPQPCGGDVRGAAPAHRAGHLACPWRGSRGTARRRPRPTAARNLLRHHGKKKIGALRPRNGRPPAQPPSPLAPGVPRIRAHANGGAYRVGSGEGGCSRVSRMSMSVLSGERQAVCARRVGVRRPKGVGRGVAEPHEVGTDTRNDDSKIDC